MKKNYKYPFLLFLIILVLWSFYRFFFHFPEWVDELLAKPLMMLIPVFILIFKVEKKPLGSIGISNKNLFKNILIGLAAGIFISFEAIITNKFKNGSVIFNPENISGLPLLLIFIIPFATGFVEEVAFRGYIMNRFWEVFKNEFPANILSTVLFVATHLPMLLLVQRLSNFDLLTSLIQLFVLGAFDGYIFARTRTIVAPTISHSLWNLSTVLFR